MTGPEHYREAQRVIADITQPSTINPQVRILKAGDCSEALALAQVHATLALAAATALGTPEGQPCGDADDWNYVASAGLVGVIDQGGAA